MKKIITLLLLIYGFSVNAQKMEWVLLSSDTDTGNSCPSVTDCNQNILCFGLKYTPGTSGTLVSYTTGFLVNFVSTGNPIVVNDDGKSSNKSCVMLDNSSMEENSGWVKFNSSGVDGDIEVTEGVPVILHQICLKIPKGEKVQIIEEGVIGLTANVKPNAGRGESCEFSSPFTVDRDALCPACEVAPTLDTNNNIFTKAGISTLDRNVDGSWVDNSKSGFLKLESKTLGFVPTRMTTTERDALTAEEGMVVWNITNKCLEYYNGTEWVCSQPKCKNDNQ